MEDNNSQSTNADSLLTKAELAEKLRLKVRGVECLMSARKIRFIRISHRCVRFNYRHVLEDLGGFEEGTDNPVP